LSVQPILEAEHLVKVFPIGGFFGGGQLTAVDDISFQIPGDKPAIVTLLGESGSGKSTIARMLLHLIKPTTGEIRYKGKDLKRMSWHEKQTYRREVQAVFQDPYGAYNPFYRVNHVLAVPLKKFKLASSLEEMRRIMAEAMEAVGLRPEEVLDRYPHQLSGGQRQRLMIARCLPMEPRIIVADEPVSMIDASLRAGILDVFLELKRKYEMSLLFVTHDLSVAYYLSDTMIVLYDGRVVERGDAEAIVRRGVHPYVQLLMSSVPLPNPEKRWKERLDLKATDLRRRAESRTGCVFNNRCPRHWEKCAKTPPEMISLESEHEVACHLYS